MRHNEQFRAFWSAGDVRAEPVVPGVRVARGRPPEHQPRRDVRERQRQRKWTGQRGARGLLGGARIDRQPKATGVRRQVGQQRPWNLHQGWPREQNAHSHLQDLQGHGRRSD